MEIHFPHLNNGTHTAKRKHRFVTHKRLMTVAVTFALCSSAIVILAACNIGGGGY